MKNRQLETTFNIYLFYRLTLSIALLALFFIDQSLQVSAQFQSTDFLFFSLAYLFVCGLSLSLKNMAQGQDKRYIYSIILTDILFISALHYIAGGMVSGISILLFAPVAASAIFFLGLAANFTAAMASIAVLLSSYYEVLFYQREQSELVSSGILGLALFATSIFVQRLAQNIRSTQAELEEQSDEIKYLEKLNQHIVKRLRTGIVVFSPSGAIKLSNDAALHLLGENFTPNHHISGQFHKAFINWQHKHAPTESFQQQLGLAEVQVSFIINDSNDNHRDIIAFIDNLTALSQQAQQIKLAALGRLSASIAHEIRNPLSAISHSTQLLYESDYSNSADKRLLDIISNHSKRLDNIVTSTLELSKRRTPNIKQLELNAVVNDVFEQLQSAYQEPLKLTLSSKSKFYTRFDTGQLQQILSNLLDNAVRHSQMNQQGLYGHIELCNDSENHALIKIRDKGTGINKEDIEKIFEPFYTTHKKGTGLGLFLAKELCQLNHSELDYVKLEHDAYFQIRCCHPDKHTM